MVNNPDRGDSYVPTTTSAVYLPRRGHHVYNGYEWVDEGLLHESEARTNIYGAQLEGSTPSSYIPTSGSTVTRAAETLTIPSANLPWPTPQYIGDELVTNGTFDTDSAWNPLSVSIQMDGRMTYADDGTNNTVTLASWPLNASNAIGLSVETDVSGGTGGFEVVQVANGVVEIIQTINTYSPDILVPYSIASRHGSTFVNGAVDGTALTADTTPTALPDLSSTDLNLGPDYMGTIKTFRIWDRDLTDTGIAIASDNPDLLLQDGFSMLTESNEFIILEQ
jgi:hypothetical protein